ncbi:mucin-4 isoform X5 [Bos indicus]|uniref:Mucin-4 isoform X5 n=1 Tax=Bos indicus TaxID=9915 RepID=A0ABM4SBE6_BOSIN
MTTGPEKQSTLPPSTTSTGKTSASSQNHQTPSMKTTRGTQTTTITAVRTSTLSSSTRALKSTEDTSQRTSPSGTTITSFPPYVRHTPTVTSKIWRTKTSADTTVGNPRNTSPTLLRHIHPVSTVSITTGPEKQSTLPPSTTSTGKTSMSPQNRQTPSMKTTSGIQTTTITAVRTSTVSSSTHAHRSREGTSQRTPPSGTTTTSFPPHVRQTPTVTSKIWRTKTSADTTVGNPRNTSPTLPRHIHPVSTVSMTTGPEKQSTLPPSTTSTGKTSASSQNHQTPSMKTTRGTQTTTITAVRTSTVSSSTHALKSTEDTSQRTSPSGTTITSFPPYVRYTPTVTSKIWRTKTSADITVGNPRNTSPTLPRHIHPVSTVSMTTGSEKQSTLPPFTTSTGKTSMSPQNHQTPSMKTTSGTQTTTITAVRTSTVSSSTHAHRSREGTSQRTPPSGTTTTSFPPYVRHTPTVTSKIWRTKTSADTTVGNPRNTSPTLPRHIHPVSTVSMTTGPEKQSTLPPSTTSTGKTSASSQNHQTPSMKTTRGTQTTTITAVRTSTLSSSTRALKSTEDTSQRTPPSGTTTTSFPPYVRHTPTVTSKIWRTKTSADTTVGNPRNTSPTLPRHIHPVSTVSMTTGPEKQSTLPPSTTSTGKTSASSQNHQTPSMKTTRGTQTTTITAVRTSTLSSSTRALKSTEDTSQRTSPSGTTITSFPPYVRHTPTVTSKIWRTKTSADTTVGNPRNTSPTLPRHIHPVSTVSMTTGPEKQSTLPPSTTSTGKTSASSQNHQTPSMKTTSGTQTTTITAVRTSTVSSSTHAHRSTEGTSQRTSPSAPDPAVTWSSATRFTSHPTPLSVTSTSPTVTGSTMKAETSEKSTTSQKADCGGSTASLPSTTSQTLTTSTPGTSTGVLLFPYGPSAGDQEFVRRTVDFTSPLFKPQIGFPLGSLLWDSLYFTDNGQIIFPKSDYQIFSYPNPPLRGFSDWDSVAMVAPFWDDADFSSSRGTIFYQEYETLYDDYNTLVQKVESSINTLTKTGNYKARWTLKITWVHVPAYPAQVTIGTNTYQAILSTDGSRSYALFLYQSGGMQWTVTGRPGNPVLMGFSSGDGYFKNSQLTFHPVWEKYRPDQFLDSNSGLRGLQIYKLHREEKPNYRLRCLQWLKRQPQWPSWGWNQISCPCSWNQGVLDLRFQSISRGSRQLCSFSSWRGGVCCRYGPWGELLQGWRVQSPWQLDQELELQNWCCHFNSNPSFCALYQLRRPPVSCTGYQPSSLAWMVGDPHITTLDGVNYTFNGLGDFLLVRTQDRNSSFLLQGRTAQTRSANATNFIGFAAEYRSSSLHPITVQWLLKPNNTIHVQLNNQTIAFETNGEDTKDQEIFNSSGVIMTHHGSTVSASFDGAVAISVLAISNILHISCSLSKGYQNHTEGLMGFWNGNPDDDFRMPNGSTIPKRSSEEMLFHYGMTWKINGTSLFGKRDDNLPSSFTPVFLSQLLRNTSLNKNLTSSCHGDDQCIFDVLATGSEKLGNDTRAIFRIYQQMNTTLNRYPPSIKGPDVIKAYMGQTTVVNYTSDAKDITFTLRENCTDFKLFENGTLLWTPKLLEPFTLEILASSDQGSLSSVLKPRTVVCECKAESQCLYNQTSWVNNSSLEAADCKCDGNTFGRYCNYSKDPCDEQCFPNVKCISGKGCEACPPHLTGDGRHCASLEKPFLCQNKSCPEDYCYNNGFCSVSHTLGCQPVCTCPSAFTDARCFLAGNNFTPTVHQELPLRIIQLSLTEDENASQADVNASVAYRLKNLELWAFLWNRQVDQTECEHAGNLLAMQWLQGLPPGLQPPGWLHLRVPLQSGLL